MSRIGKKPIPLPAGVKVNVAGRAVTVEGKLGKLEYTHRPEIAVKVEDDGKTVVFEVSKDANKIDIKRAIEKLLGAKVADVRTSITRGKLKRQGRFVGRRSDWKKAYVTLRAGEKLPDFLEGA